MVALITGMFLAKQWSVVQHEVHFHCVVHFHSILPVHHSIRLRTNQRCDVQHRRLLVWWNGMYGSLWSLLHLLYQHVLKW